MQLLKVMQATVKRGISVLHPEAIDELSASVLRMRHPEGGFCGLDGSPDLYYSFFAVHILDALNHKYDDVLLQEFVKSACSRSSGVDRICAELLLLRGGRSKNIARFDSIRRLIDKGPPDSYKLFLTGLLMEQLFPEGFNRFLLRRAASAALKHRNLKDFSVLSTPGAAVCYILAEEAGDNDAVERMSTLLKQRHRSSGGYSSAPGAAADLLSTAVVLFAGSYVHNTHFDDSQYVSTPNDRAFVELCWQDDGLFSPAPDQPDGDLEHTYYGLLALGSLCPQLQSAGVD